MNPRRFLAALVLAAALGVAGCAPYASVSSVRPGFHPVRSTAGALALVERRISTALGQQKREPLMALGEFLAAAKSAQQELVRDPGNFAARDAYNFAVARVIGTIQQAKLDPRMRPLRVQTADGDFLLIYKPDVDPHRNPALYRSHTSRSASHQGRLCPPARDQGRHRCAPRRCRERRERPPTARSHDAEDLLRLSPH